MNLRDLPSVDALLRELEPELSLYPRSLVVDEIRGALSDIRRGDAPAEPIAETVRRRLLALEQSSLRRVINATGVILHTNLGRAPLGPLAPLPGYSNLEYDLATGRRGKRDFHTRGLLERLLGVPGICVNNNAAATFLVLHELAAGHEVIVSRGELIEIGDGFRIPEIMERSGAILREVGTTNKTSLDDYRSAINDRTRLILRVHPSNFHISGFTAKPSLKELCSLPVPVYEDLGSGCLVDLRPQGIDEPLVRESLDAGVALLSFSCDKLLGGPQTGIVAGRPELVDRVRRNPMFRALRVDKLIVQTLEQKLRALLLQRYDQVPALRMIRTSAEEIRRRAEALAARLPNARVVEGRSVIGGGATPDQSLLTWLVALSPALVVEAEKQLRANDPPVIARIQNNELLVDLRTVFPEEEAELEAALQALSM